MDVLKFVNSDAIRKHLKEINYQFNAIEVVWLIKHSFDFAFEERKRAYYDVIDNYPDMSYEKDSLPEKINSVHQAIIEYVALTEKYYKEFMKNDETCFFEVTVNYPNYPKENIKTTFKEYDDAIKYIVVNKKEYYLVNTFYQDIVNPILFNEIKIEKKQYGSEKCIGTVYLNSELEFKRLLYSKSENEHANNIMHNFIDSMWFKFPVPFKKGDILVYKYWDKTHIGYTCQGPFVLDKMCHELCGDEEGYDSSDMTAYGYFIWEDGTVYHEVMNDYMNLEYYADSFENEKRTLITISNYLKGKLSLDLFLNAYNLIIADENYKKSKKRTWYTKAAFIDSGVEKDPNIHIKIWLDDKRPAPNGYIHCRSVNEVINNIYQCERDKVYIDLLDLDHDLGEYAKDGGDGIKLIDWLAETKRFYKINLHTMNPVGKENMQREIDRYWPKYE